MTLRFLMMLCLLCVCISGCAQTSCAPYDRLAKSDSGRLEIVNWVDQMFFLRGLSDDDFGGGNLVGPGRVGVFRRAFYQESLPASLGQIEKIIGPIEIRPMGADRKNPEAVFIGGKSFQGIVITRREFTDSFAILGFSVDENFRRMDHRMGVMCFVD